MKDFLTCFFFFIFSIVVTFFIRKLAIKFKVVDKADGNELKIHKKSIALMGGIAILIVFIIAFFVKGLVFLPVGVSLLLGAMLVCIIGLVDDIKNLNPYFRIIVHILSAIILMVFGLKLVFFHNDILNYLLTIFCVISVINAYNLIDGMDGLCTGVSMISCVGFFMLALEQHNELLINLSLILFFILLGFLFFNFHPANIFLGDAGSGLLGFLLGAMFLISLKNGFDIRSILIIFVPLFDMVSAIIRRLINRKSIFQGDRNHIYDLFLKKHFSQRKVWSIIITFQLLLVFIGFLKI